MASFRPRNEAEAADFLRGRSEEKKPVALRGGGTKRSFARPDPSDTTTLDLSALSGIVLYEPEELVMTARAGTPLDDVEAALAQHNQCLAFEPPRLGAFFGTSEGHSTLGGVVAAGFSGPRRVKAGAVRDHMLGMCAIGGDGQGFKSGGRVVKNVTGFDLPKLLAGSHGTLAAITEITVKVLPAPETTQTLLLFGLDDAAGIRALAEALGGPFDVSGAAHLPAASARHSRFPEISGTETSVTALRFEGFGPSVTDRFAAAAARFSVLAASTYLDAAESLIFWKDIRDLAPLIPDDRLVWRLSVPPSDASSIVARIQGRAPAEAIYDWGGGLIWLMLPPADDAHVSLVRGALPSGHATLFRAPGAVREKIPVFQPQPAGLAALTRRVKAAFDPNGILSPGRMTAGS